MAASSRISTFAALVFCIASSATTPNAVLWFSFPDEPSWVSDASGFSGAVAINGSDESLTNVFGGSLFSSSAEVQYKYPDTEWRWVTAQPDRARPGLFRFKIPANPESGPGTLTYEAKIAIGNNTGDDMRSERRTIPLALEKELDITGDAAIALLYPLGGSEYTVRYVPCCNIFGGITIATRVPVNPVPTDAGLPSKRLSDFIVLKPDGLSASTMGMYFDFLLGADRFKGVKPALYEFDGSAWVEFKTYEVDTATGRISMHCPNGGTFVLAAKP